MIQSAQDFGPYRVLSSSVKPPTHIDDSEMLIVQPRQNEGSVRMYARASARRR